MADRPSDFSKIKHLYHRAAFGLNVAAIPLVKKQNFKQAVNALFELPLARQDLQTVSFEEFKAQQETLANLGLKNEYTPEQKLQRQEITRLQNLKSQSLNLDWMEQMMRTQYPFLEKMTLFWHGHFSCRSNNPYYALQLHNTQRSNAFGSFKTLLTEVSKTPAMLEYLNNQQNKKGKPNENFARELMELFTLGIGNYTEMDVKEAARAFTGWMHNKNGDFVFNVKLHDGLSKTFFGETGLFDGDTIIDMILERPETATFICRKMYIFFVNDKPHEAHIKELAQYFYSHNYNIAAVMKKMFTSDWFYDELNTGQKIKSPIELLIGLGRQFDIHYQRPQLLIRLQTSLGQYLFNPPNVSGWAGGKNWIDSSSLMFRLKIPSLLLNDGVIDFDGKTDPEEEALIALPAKVKAKPIKSQVNASVNWDKFIAGLPEGMDQSALATFLLATAIDSKTKQLFFSNKSLKMTAIAVTSMPEYQLC